MNLRRVRAVAVKETLHILRDPRSLGMAIAIPMLLLLLFGYALTLDVDDVPMVVWDQSGSPASRELVSRFAGSRYFTVRGRVAGYAEVERAIDRREALVALVVPADYARRLATGGQAVVQAIVDGSDANTATIAIGYAHAIVRDCSQDIVVQQFRQLGMREPSTPLELRPRVWYNPDLESRNAIVPGLTAVIMMIIAALLTSLTVAREWERGTMEQLISTPVKGPELILGKLIPYFAVGMLDVLIAVLVGEFVFGVPLRGSAALVFAMAAVFLAGALSLGILISIVTRNQLLASQLAMITTFLPAFLLSGFMYAIANMPTPLQWVTYLVPARYFVVLLKGIYMKGVGLEVLVLEAALLASFGTAMVLLAVGRFRKRLV
jgi:ABC-2 type transport system permease protein